jgi:hypothetical protein
MTDQTGRRSFLGTLAALSGAAALELSHPAAAFAAAHSSDPQQGPWDLTWLELLKGKHKQVFDTSEFDFALLVPTNNLDAYRDVYGLSYPDVNIVIGIAGSTYPINASDAIWAKYELGRRWKVKEPGTDAWATRNIYLNGAMNRGKMVGVKPLMDRGAIFWQCNNALNGVTQMIATDLKLEIPALKAELVAGLNPGVHLVPAHTMALGLVQERGCAYEKI